MKTIFASVAALLVLSACATPATETTQNGETKEMPEYATGSIIAKKNKAPAPTNVRSADPSQLDEIRNNAAGGIRAN